MGKFRWEANDSACLVVQDPGSGKAVLLSYLPDMADFVAHIVSAVPVGAEIGGEDVERELLELGQP